MRLAVVLVGRTGRGMFADDLCTAGMSTGQHFGKSDAAAGDLRAHRVSELQRIRHGDGSAAPVESRGSDHCYLVVGSAVDGDGLSGSGSPPD